MEEQKFDEMIRETEAENAQKTPQKYTDPEKKKGAWKAKIIAWLIFAVALFGFGFYFGVKYGIQMYRMSYQIQSLFPPLWFGSYQFDIGLLLPYPGLLSFVVLTLPVKPQVLLVPG
ncbi:hypothetical protein [Eubacterium aggregans]|uniref:hypothetical protein n=1 Tax=Eubacterium aggregans TaxID=81409 RepID=UPI003F2AC194